jgi:hypothetical protein
MKIHALISTFAQSLRSVSFGLRLVELGALTCACVSVGGAAVPVIVSSPATQLATEGTNVQLTVTATSADALHYQWKQDGTAVGTDSATLTLAPVLATEQGVYVVAVSNSSGTVTSAPFSVLTEPAVPAFVQSRLDALSADTLAANNWTPVKIPGFRQQVMDAELAGVGQVWQNIPRDLAT